MKDLAIPRRRIVIAMGLVAIANVLPSYSVGVNCPVTAIAVAAASHAPLTGCEWGFEV